MRDLLKKALPGVFVTISSECSQEYREFERGSTVAANAYVGPPVQRYMRNLKSGSRMRVHSDISIMQSNGGVCTIYESAAAGQASSKRAGGWRHGPAVPGGHRRNPEDGGYRYRRDFCGRFRRGGRPGQMDEPTECRMGASAAFPQCRRGLYRFRRRVGRLDRPGGRPALGPESAAAVPGPPATGAAVPGRPQQMHMLSWGSSAKTVSPTARCTCDGIWPRRL